MASGGDHETVQAMVDGAARQAILELSLGWQLPAALRVIVELGVPGILATHARRRAPLVYERGGDSAPCRSSSALNLERLLRLLTCKAHVSCKEELDNGAIRRFALTLMSRVLLPDHPRGTFQDVVLLLTLGPEHAHALQHLGASVVNSEQPFAKAHGMNQFEYMRVHPEFLTVFQNAFRAFTPWIAETMLSKYYGFAGVRTMVDVGGNTGMILAHIVKKYPHIRGINFHLPQVVAENPTFPGKKPISKFSPNSPEN